MNRRYELFHEISDSGSAAARRVIVERGLEQVRLRNINYPEVVADLGARGGRGAPALWDGEVLVEGEAAVLAALAALSPSA